MARSFDKLILDLDSSVAEVAVPCRLYRAILERIRRLASTAACPLNVGLEVNRISIRTTCWAGKRAQRMDSRTAGLLYCRA